MRNSYYFSGPRTSDKFKQKKKKKQDIEKTEGLIT